MTTLCESAGGDKVLGQRTCKCNIVKLDLHLMAIDDDHSGDSTMDMYVDCAVVTELDRGVVYQEEI